MDLFLDPIGKLLPLTCEENHIAEFSIFNELAAL